MTPLYDDGRNRLGNSSIALLIVLGIGMIVAIFIGLTIGQGDLKKVYMIALGLGAFPALLFLGDKYWVLLPFAMTASLPAVPIIAGRSVSFGELWVIASIGAFILRFPFVNQKLRVFRMDFLPVLLYAAWAGLIYKVNGAGLAILGASTVGGRSYLTIAMTVIAFFILCNQRIGEKEAKWIIWSIISASIVSSVWGITRFHFFPSEAEPEDLSFYSWHQHLSGISVYVLAYVFARYSPTDLFARFNIFVMGVVGVCYGLAAFSGKRAALFACVLFPIMSAWMRKKYGFILAALTGMAMIIVVLVTGHGSVFHLPQTVQRVLWIFPGDWDYSVRVNTSGSFRRTLNRLAIKQIEKRPIIGQGFGFTSLDAWMATDPNALKRIVQDGDHYGAFIMAASGEWHSTWLGMAATFGIPAAVIWALVWLKLFSTSVWVVKRAPPNSYTKLLATIILMFTVVALVTSMTSGHPAKTFWNASWKLAIVLVFKWQILAEMRAARAAAEPSAPPRSVRARMRAAERLPQH